MAMDTGLIFHPYMRPGRTARQTFEWGVQSSIACDKMGFTTMMISEHASQIWENIPAPELIMAADAVLERLYGGAQRHAGSHAQPNGDGDKRDEGVQLEAGDCNDQCDHRTQCVEEQQRVWTHAGEGTSRRAFISEGEWGARSTSAKRGRCGRCGRRDAGDECCDQILRRFVNVTHPRLFVGRGFL